MYLIFMSVITRFKVHIQVIDNTRSTTFILFDRIVAQGLGRSTQDLVDAIAEVLFFPFISDLLIVTSQKIFKKPFLPNYYLLCLQRNVDSSYPEELNLFVDKRMLFKVEVNDSNLYRNWRSYTVKKMIADDEIITRFISHHGINVNI